MWFFRFATLGIFAYVASFLWIWWRVERLREEPGPKAHLPPPVSFLTGSAFFWLWSDEHRQGSDARLTAGVIAARCFLGLSLVLVGLSYFFP
jgi:hypothetical protein